MIDLTILRRKALAAISKTRCSPSQRKEASSTNRKRERLSSRAEERAVKSVSPSMVPAMALRIWMSGRRWMKWA